MSPVSSKSLSPYVEDSDRVHIFTLISQNKNFWESLEFECSCLGVFPSGALDSSRSQRTCRIFELETFARRYSKKYSEPLLKHKWKYYNVKILHSKLQEAS